jgi:hemerythrin-like metal-binding protein
MQQEVLRAIYPLQWREEWSVGIPELDAQHRHLIELLDELVKCTRSGGSCGFSPKALNEITRYAEGHLRREELVLRIRGYPGYTEHKAEHDAYRAQAASLQLQYARRDVDVRIANFLTGWWRFHIRISDQRYARFFRCHPSSG